LTGSNLVISKNFSSWLLASNGDKIVKVY